VPVIVSHAVIRPVTWFHRARPLTAVSAVHRTPRKVILVALAGPA